MTSLTVEPLTLRVNIIDQHSDSNASRTMFGMVKGTNESISFEPSQMQQGKDALKATSWNIPSYDYREDWRDQIEAVPFGYNFGFFRFGLGTLNESEEEWKSNIENNFHILRELNKEFGKQEESFEFRFEYGMFAVSDGKCSDLETLKSHTASQAETLPRFVEDCMLGADNLEQVIAALDEKHSGGSLFHPFVLIINVQIIEKGGNQSLRTSRLCFGNLGTVFLNDLKPSTNLDKSFCLLRKYLLFMSTSSNGMVDIPICPLLFFVRDYFGGSAKTICVVDVDSKVTVRDQYSSILFLEVLSKVRNVTRIQYEDSRLLELDQLDVLESQLEDMKGQNENLLKELSNQRVRFQQMEDEKDRVYMSALKEAADIRFISEGRSVEIVNLKNEIREKNLSLLHLQETIDEQKVEINKLKVEAEKNEEAIEVSNNEIYQLELEITALNEKCEKLTNEKKNASREAEAASNQHANELSSLKAEHEQVVKELEQKLKSAEREISLNSQLNVRNDASLRALKDTLVNQLNEAEALIVKGNSRNFELTNQINSLELQISSLKKEKELIRQELKFSEAKRSLGASHSKERDDEQTVMHIDPPVEEEEEKRVKNNNRKRPKKVEPVEVEEEEEEETVISEPEPVLPAKKKRAKTIASTEEVKPTLPEEENTVVLINEEANDKAPEQVVEKVEEKTSEVVESTNAISAETEEPNASSAPVKKGRGRPKKAATATTTAAKAPVPVVEETFSMPEKVVSPTPIRAAPKGSMMNNNNTASSEPVKEKEATNSMITPVNNLQPWYGESKSNLNNNVSTSNLKDKLLSTGSSSVNSYGVDSGKRTAAITNAGKSASLVIKSSNSSIASALYNNNNNNNKTNQSSSMSLLDPEKRKIRLPTVSKRNVNGASMLASNIISLPNASNHHSANSTTTNTNTKSTHINVAKFGGISNSFKFIPGGSSNSNSNSSSSNNGVNSNNPGSSSSNK